MTDAAGPSQPPHDPTIPSRLGSPILYYPVETPHSLPYYDYEARVTRVCEPLAGAPCFCPSRDPYPYPTWVVLQIDRERRDLFRVAVEERRERRSIVEEYHQLFRVQDGILDEVEAKLADTVSQLTEMTQQVTAQGQEIDRLRQCIQRQEERLQRIRQDLEPTVVISSSVHAEPQGSDHSVNQSSAAHADQPGPQAARGHSESEPSEGG